ncbi:cytochrome b/b6 domain-containing protein [Bdellovibrio sp. 22V]|uniref:cytochrome b/b6 domain-containing protein n=1 Tax=Bdellovibrio TaxID=958 RepID=UPI0025437096|nr:cytochrome b/b6 domain-containing protein [Bdellovibrio sp. 22V]WII73583.1 cytochrome b/b6 domain-containing protein [Bdellovibrio sp. 22V]
MNTSEKRIYVWDVFVRVFHWTLVVCIFLNYFITEEGDKPHEIIGYVAAGFVVARFLWGFFGSPYARFSRWLASPKTVFKYLVDFKNRKPSLAHNPVAGWMMIFLMICVLALGVTGYMMSMDRFFGEDWVEDLHHNIANVMMAGVAIHIIGALYESYHEKQNLVAGMIHGYKNKVE